MARRPPLGNEPFEATSWFPPAAIFFVTGIACTPLAWLAEGTVSGGYGSPTSHRLLRATFLGTPLALALALLVLRIRGHRWARWLAFGLGALMPHALVALFIIAPDLSEVLHRKHFDATRWQAAATSHADERLTMVDDLLDTRRLEGLDRERVDALLGPDDSDQGTGYAQGYFADWDRVYFLGPERGLFSIDSEWLVLRFDPEGRVTEARIVRD